MGTEATNAPAAAPAAPAGNSSASIAAKLTAMAAEAPAPAVAPPAPSAEAPPPAALDLPSREQGKLQKALDALTKAEATGLDYKAKHESAQARIAEFEKQVAEFEALKKGGDVNKLLQYGKVTPEQLGKLFMEGKLQFTPQPEAPPAPEFPKDVQEALEYAKVAKEREERSAQQKAYEEARAADLATLRGVLPSLAEKFPFAVALPSTADALLNALEPGSEPTIADIEKLLTDAEPKVRAEIDAVVGTEATLKYLVETHGDKLRALLGVPAPRQAAAAPTTLTNRTASAVPSQSTKASTSAEIAARLEGLKRGA